MVNKNWSKIKGNKELHENYLLKRREYYAKNKKRINENAKSRSKELRVIARQMNHCTTCFKKKSSRDDPKFIRCNKCRIKSRVKKKIKQDKKEKIFSCIPNGDFNDESFSLIHVAEKAVFELDTGQNWILLTERKLSVKQYSEIQKVLEMEEDDERTAL